MSVTVERCARANPKAQDYGWEASEYRERARELRVLAWRTRSREARRELMSLALRHELLADYIETHPRDSYRLRTEAAD